MGLEHLWLTSLQALFSVQSQKTHHQVVSLLLPTLLPHQLQYSQLHFSEQAVLQFSLLVVSSVPVVLQSSRKVAVSSALATSQQQEAFSVLGQLHFLLTHPRSQKEAAFSALRLASQQQEVSLATLVLNQPLVVYSAHQLLLPTCLKSHQGHSLPQILICSASQRNQRMLIKRKAIRMRTRMEPMLKMMNLQL